jgi:hypothetical protein
MSFMPVFLSVSDRAIFVIHVGLCNLYQLMSFMSIHVIHVIEHFWKFSKAVERSGVKYTTSKAFVDCFAPNVSVKVMYEYPAYVYCASRLPALRCCCKSSLLSPVVIINMLHFMVPNLGKGQQQQ